jgi:Cu-Zn family superoxide dismutase
MRQLVMTTIETYRLPGDISSRPEGITTGIDADFYVGSLRDGSIFHGRLDSETAQVWQQPGEDGRTSVLGMALHAGRNLVACGGRTGHVFVYDLASGGLVARRTVASEPTLLNDVWVVGDTAYVTDSARPVVWRLSLADPGGVGEPEVFADLAAAGETPYLNGVVATADESALIVAAQAVGALWRVDLASGAARTVELPEGYQFAADGLLLLDDRTLLGICNEGDTRETAVFFLEGLRLDGSASVGVPFGRWTDPRMDTPTTIAVAADGRLLLVNSQLARLEPVPPFTVIAMNVPHEAVA